MRGIEMLDTPELERFFSQIGILLARRKAPSVPQREVVLLQQIKTLLPAQTLAEYQKLSQKLRDECITPDEHAHLLTLVDVVKLVDAERMQHLFELAQLRNVPLDTLMQQLGIQTPAPYV